MRPDWDQFFMNIALEVAKRSTCNRIQVGALLVKDHSIIAFGYNGSAAGDKHCSDVGCEIGESGCQRTIHSELNALLHCAKHGISTAGAVCYTTHYTCYECAKQLTQAGVRRVVYREVFNRKDPRAEQLYADLNMAVEQLTPAPEL